MSRQPSKALSVLLWIVQLLMAVTLLWAAFMKLAAPPEKLAGMWPWTAQIPRSTVQLTGLADGLGGLGLVLPALLRIRPVLTPIAAICLFLLLIAATVFHLSRGEGSQTGFNVLFAGLAAFVAWGRLGRARIAPRIA